jgi:glycosyltransferase involved in cell wall biosynthesis
MRVAALIATESVSGPGRQLAALADRLADVGVDLRVLVFNRHMERMPPFAEHLARAGVAYSVIADGGALDWSMVTAVRRHLDEHGATIVQTHGYKASAIGYALKRQPGARPWIGCFHGVTRKGLKDGMYHGIERWMLRAADRIVVVARSQLSSFPGCGDRTHVIDNAIIPLRRSRELAPVTLPDMPRPRIGVIGRLSREKGIDLFLQACAQLRDAGRGFSAVIVGDGPEETSLRQLCETLKLRDVHFAGRVDEMTGIYEQLDLVVLPSRSEGLPNVLLEAVHAGVPVVATSVGAVPDVLRDPAAGVLVPPGKPHALADGIAKALSMAPSENAARARMEVLERFSIERRVEQHLRIYRAITAPLPLLETP